MRAWPACARRAWAARDSTCGQISPDVPGFSGHQVEVVEQPFRRRRDELSGPDVVGQRAVRSAQDSHVVVEAGKDVLRAPSPVGIDREARGERQRAFLEPFDAQELVAQRFFGG